jgi:hypothetical protein
MASFRIRKDKFNECLASSLKTAASSLLPKALQNSYIKQSKLGRKIPGH